MENQAPRHTFMVRPRERVATLVGGGNSPMTATSNPRNAGVWLLDTEPIVAELSLGVARGYGLEGPGLRGFKAKYARP